MAKAKEKKSTETWFKRWKAAEDTKEEHDAQYRTRECYNYWKGNQLIYPFDEYGNRRVQVNKIHADVRTQIPSLYFYRPSVRITAEPEEADTLGSSLEDSTQLLQDTANHLVRNPDTQFRDSTYVALKEAFWNMGCVEVGYSPDFGDAPNAIRPPLKEDDKTKMPPVPKDNKPPEEVNLDDLGDDPDELMEELKRLKANLKDETFYVKHIPARQVMISNSDKPNLEDNDWVGYWEEHSIEDVKRVPAYKNTKDLKVTYSNKEDEERKRAWSEETGEEQRIRLFKIWDIRTKTRYVLAEGHKQYLLVKKFKRLPLKFLRFDIDPYHFYPIPPIFHKLGVQDEYNHSRETLRRFREVIVPRFTYDEDAIEAAQMRKLERGTAGAYIPRRGQTSGAIEPVMQPSMSGDALNTLTISDKEFADVSGVGGDSRVAQTKTATQAKIAEVKEQSQDSFDRGILAEWLADIIKELILLTIDHMSIDRFIATNVDQQAQMYNEEAMQVAQQFQMINADVLADEAAGIRWDVIVDVDALSPVSEEEKFQKWMQGLNFITNPMSAQLFAVAPQLLDYTLNLMGFRAGKGKALIQQGLQAFSQMQQQMAQQGMNPGNAPGVSGQGGSNAAPPSQPNPSGPQPGGPQSEGPTPPPRQFIPAG
jgi:hypothetical protein